jgi:hypothetical protein
MIKVLNGKAKGHLVGNRNWQRGRLLRTKNMLVSSTREHLLTKEEWLLFQKINTDLRKLAEMLQKDVGLIEK